MLVHAPHVTEEVLRNKLGAPGSKLTREELIDLYLKQVHESARSRSRSPVKKSAKTAAGGQPGAARGKGGGGGSGSRAAPKEGKAQMLDRLKGYAEKLCKSKKSETIDCAGSSIRLTEVRRPPFFSAIQRVALFIAVCEPFFVNRSLLPARSGARSWRGCPHLQGRVCFWQVGGTCRRCEDAASAQRHGVSGNDHVMCRHVCRARCGQWERCIDTCLLTSSFTRRSRQSRTS